MRGALLVLGLSTAACAPKGLEGSLSVLMDLTYQKAEVLSSDQELVLRFSKPEGGGENTVFKLTYFLDGTPIVSGEEIDLSGQRSQGGPKTVTSRDVLNDPRTAFPTLLLGGLLLNSPPVSGQAVSGSFHLTYNECIDFGCGRTVFGDYQASVP